MWTQLPVGDIALEVAVARRCAVIARGRRPIVIRMSGALGDVRGCLRSAPGGPAPLTGRGHQEDEPAIAMATMMTIAPDHARPFRRSRAGGLDLAALLFDPPLTRGDPFGRLGRRLCHVRLGIAARGFGSSATRLGRARASRGVDLAAHGELVAHAADTSGTPVAMSMAACSTASLGTSPRRMTTPCRESTRMHVGRRALVLGQRIGDLAHDVRIGDQLVDDRHRPRSCARPARRRSASAAGVRTRPRRRTLVALDVDEDLGVRGAQRLVVPQHAPHAAVGLLLGPFEVAIGCANYPAHLSALPPSSDAVVCAARVRAPAHSQIRRRAPTRRCPVLVVNDATLLKNCVASHISRSSSVGVLSTTCKNSTGASEPERRAREQHQVGGDDARDRAARADRRRLGRGCASRVRQAADQRRSTIQHARTRPVRGAARRAVPKTPR